VLCAVKNAHEDVLELLLQAGAKLDFTSPYSETPLITATHLDHEAIVGLLLKAGAECPPANLWLDLPLSRAARFVKLLIERGANVNSEPCVQDTPL
jgi:hypothetical protein